MSSAAMNHDPHEIARFETTAGRWWDPQGEFRPLHEMNPLRTDYIHRRAPLNGRKVLDVGCGGGLLCEAMSKLGAQVTGIDLGQTAIQVAQLHALDSGAVVKYQQQSAEQHALDHPGRYDVITCLEMLEHVPDPASVIDAIRTMLRPGGNAFFSTINRNAKSYLLAVVGAEYVLNLLPRGTHTYSRFIRPAELAGWTRAAGMSSEDISGIEYNPLTRAFRLSDNVDVNYIVHVRREENGL